MLTVCDRPTLSYQRLQTIEVLTDQQLYDKIRRSVANKHELQVLESFLIFNKYDSVCYPHFEQIIDCDCQACSKDQLLPTHQGCSLFPSCARLFARSGVPEEALWHLLCDWQRFPRVPYSLQRCCSWRNSYGSIEEQGVSASSRYCMLQ
jgi:hypothetical protein